MALLHWTGSFLLFMWKILTIACTIRLNQDKKACQEVVPRFLYSCYGRNLSHVPASIPPSTQHLDFSFNYLNILHRHTFKRLTYLQHLDLTRCHIQHIDNDAFVNVRNLSVLILTGNPVEYFGKSSINILEKLHKLVLTDIGLLSLDSLNLQNLTSLQELNVGTNRLFSLALPTYAVSFKNFTLLDLHTNNISVIRAVHTSVLRHMGSNITLILSRNPIAFIEPGAFTGLNLEEINLIDTFISSIVIKYALRGLYGLNVRKLKMGSSLQMGRIRLDKSIDIICFIHFQEIFLLRSTSFYLPSHTLGCMTKCSKMYLSHVQFNSWGGFDFQNLKEIIIVYSTMATIPGPSHLPSLKTLIINNNYRTTEFKALIDLPSLEYIDLSGNQLTMGCCSFEFIGTPKLRHLNLSLNTAVKINPLGFYNFVELEILDIHNTKVTIENDAVLQTLGQLKHLDLSNSDITFTANIFHGLSSLKEMKIAGNKFEKHIFEQLFLNLTNLEVLDISNCAIEDLPWTSFQDLRNLKHLAISGNRLTTVDFLTSPSLSKLKSLHADRNQISTILPNILQNLPTGILVFDLSFNPIDCSCSQAECISWIVNHQSVLKDPQILACKSSPMDSVIDFDLTHCVHLKRVIIILPLFAALMLLLFLVLLYKYQFYINYCCILLRGYRTSSQQESSYDAFVIYSNKDETWVLDELVENLEKRVPPIQLCLHERDFKAGKSITSNIVDEGIMGSRKVIVVVSQHFLDSSWCHFEFELAQSWVVFRRTAGIIIIILEDVEDKKIQKVFGLHKYLKKNTYLKWKGNVLSNVRFWARLRKAITTRN